MTEELEQCGESFGFDVQSTYTIQIAKAYQTNKFHGVVRIMCNTRHRYTSRYFRELYNELFESFLFKQNNFPHSAISSFEYHAPTNYLWDNK